MTVFLSLSLALLLSLVMTLVEGARLGAIRMKAECSADMAMNSVLAEYNRALFDQYGLLFVDASYGTGSPSIANVERHLRGFLQNNFSVRKGLPWGEPKDWLSLETEGIRVLRWAVATDGGGKVMRDQALRYMREATVPGIAAEVVRNALEVEALGLDTRNIAAEREAVQNRIDSIPLPRRENEKGELEDIPLDNPADAVNSARSIGILGLALGDTTSVSKVKVNLKDYASHRECHRGMWPEQSASTGDSHADRLLFDDYLLRQCGSYANTLDKSVLCYQIEYILAGSDTDWRNLEKTAARLLRWREVANVICLFGDGTRCREAEMLALTLTAVLMVPELMEPVKYAILFAWAFAESVQDVKILLHGGRIPLRKTPADWRISLSHLPDFRDNLSEGGGSSGLSYEDYLRIMLFLEEDQLKNRRTMDIMEMDVRKTPGNSRFRMDWCLDRFCALIQVSGRLGFRYDLEETYGYDEGF